MSFQAPVFDQRKFSVYSVADIKEKAEAKLGDLKDNARYAQNVVASNVPKAGVPTAPSSSLSHSYGATG
jgi:hypothetical protein